LENKETKEGRFAKPKEKKIKYSKRFLFTL